MKGRLRVLVAMFFCAFLIFCLYMTRHSRSSNQNFDRAKGDSGNIASSIIAYHIMKGAFPGAEQSNQCDCVSFIFETLVREKFLALECSETNSYVFLDPWNMSYNVAIRGITMSNDAYTMAFGKINREVVVWSSGKNRVNEYGKGDDILDPDSENELDE